MLNILIHSFTLLTMLPSVFLEFLEVKGQHAYKGVLFLSMLQQRVEFDFCKVKWSFYTAKTV